MLEEVFSIEKFSYQSTMPLVDVEQLNSLLMLSDDEPDISLAKELFDLFQEESGRRLAELDSVCLGNDVGQFCKILHFLAGSAGNIGMNRLMDLFHAVERDIEAKKIQDIRDAGPEVFRLYEASCSKFKTVFCI